MVKKYLNKDYILDFMEKSRREKLMQLYSLGHSILPTSEVKPIVLKINLPILWKLI
jgi:hypothetical protein